MRPDRDSWFGWTEAHVVQLREGIEMGKSFAEIGAEIGCGRNAALGKAHRLGISVKRQSRPAPAMPVVHAGPRPSQPQHVRLLVVPRETKPQASKAPWRPKQEFNGGVPLAVGSSMKILLSDAWEALPGSHPVPLEAHKTGCRWPIGDPLEPGFGFCNVPTEGKSVYCATHSRRAYTVGA